ncbi:MAG: hypothetical protein IPF73_14100 [Betaproteobacteria bacterium]|nr:hypothetical protein [Betaproteobacteria bacterium]
MTRSKVMLLGFCAALAAGAMPARGADSLAVVDPIPVPGPYPVACSNVAQNFDLVPAMEAATEFWRGLPRSDGTPRYVTDLLAEPADTLVYSYAVPVDDELYGRYGGRTVQDVAIVCYPTTAANARADYALPNGNVVPRMQRAGDAPILPAGGPWPVVLYSHGYAGSPLDGTYLGALLTIASHGYVSVAAFHGDPRWSLLGLEAIFEEGITGEDLWKDYVAMQAIRPNSAKALLDALAAHAQWKDTLDLARVGGFGISQGGETLMLMGGAALTTTVFQDSKKVLHDTRLAAAVGYIPFFGLSWLPSFGEDQQGVVGVTLPYLAIGGTADPLAELERIEQAVRLLGGTRSVIAFPGLEHDLEPAYPGDIFTWSIVFLDSQLKRDVAATAKLQRMTAVAGGVGEERRIDYTAPLPATGDERIVVEFYHAGFDHYFVSADPAEIAGLDTGSGGWARTGLEFKAIDAAATSGLPNCRFFGVFGSVSTHFYTINADECATLMADPAWTFENYAFRADLPAAEDCPADRMRVVRVFNNFKGGALNHRFTTSASEAASLAGEGWIVEGAVFCTPP